MKNRTTRRHPAALCQIVISACLFGLLDTGAQTLPAGFTQLGPDEGFPGTIVWSVLKDSKGFMWFGCKEGLIRFDGINSRAFYPDKKDSTRLFEGNVHYLFEDSKGRIWLSAGSGVLTPKMIQVLDPRTEKFTRLKFNVMNNIFWSKQLRARNYMLEDENGSIWIQDMGRGLYEIKESPKGLLSTINHRITESYPEDISGDSVGVMFVDSNKRFWVGTKNGLYLFDKQGKRFTRYPDNHEDGSRDYVTGMVEDPGGILWVLYERKGLFQLDPSRRTIREKWATPWVIPWYWNLRYPILDHHGNLWMGRMGPAPSASLDRYTIETGIVSNYFKTDEFGEMYDIDIDREGRMWTLSDNAFIHTFDAQNNVFKLVGKLPYIYSIDIDRQLNTWISTHGAGLIVFHPSNRKVKVLINDPPAQSFSPASKVDCQENREGALFTATYRGLTKYLLNENGEITDRKTLKETPEMEFLNEVHLFRHRNEVWAYQIKSSLKGRNNPLLEVTNLKTGSSQILRLSGTPDYFGLGSAIELSDNELLFGTISSGFLHVNMKTSTIQKFQHDPSNNATPSSDMWSTVVKDDRNTVWNFNQAGFDKVDVENKKVTRMGQNLVQAMGGELYDVRAAKNGRFWIGGVNGLFLYDPSAERILQSFLVKDGHPVREIHRIVEYDPDNLWLCTSFGLSHFSVEQQRFRKFNKSDGLPSNVVYNGCRLKNGELVFVGEFGLFSLHPDAIPGNEDVPSPLVTELRLFNEVVETGSEILPQNIAYTKEVLLRHDQNFISLSYSAMSYANPGKNQFTYMMEGIDKDWNPASNRTTVSYPDLQPGTYTFKLRASNNDGLWNETPTALAITILPPWWRTSWAYGGYGVLFALALLLARRNIVQKERLRANLRVEHFELEKAKEVDKLKTSFFTNISHEFRTPLTLIKGPVQDILDEYKADPKVQAKLTMVQKNSDLLLRLINQLLDLAKLESGSLKVEKSEGDVNSFVRAVASSFEAHARQKGVRLVVEVPQNPIQGLLDKDKVETILINLINNAIKFTPSNGTITVKTEATVGQQPTTNNQQLTILVKDTGIGIPMDQQSKIFERFHQVSETHNEVGTGIGLALVKELVLLMGGEISVKSEPGKGSEFTVTLPVESTVATVPSNGSYITQHQTPKTQDPEGMSNIEHRISNIEVDSTKPQVLVVEDNADLRAFIIDSLGTEFHFLQAENGKQGLETATNEVPDLIISDVMMPEMDGIEMAKKIKADRNTSHIPLIILTAKSTEESKLSGLSSGADDYLIKPFNKQELLLKVRNSVSRQERLRERLRTELLSESPQTQVLSQDEQFLVKVKESILNKLSDEHLSVESLADDMSMSRVQLYRKVSALTGMAVNELIRKLRLHRAAQLLGQKWGPVSQVAYEVGFSQPSYFSKVFKEEFGVLPSEYVKE